MNKSSLAARITAVIMLAFVVPAFLFYYYDSKRVAQINNMNVKVLSVDNQPEIDVIKPQIVNKLDEVVAQVSSLSPEAVSKKFSPITDNAAIRTANFANKAQLAKARTAFLKAAKSLNADAALILPGAAVLEASRDAMKAVNLKANTKFIQATSSKTPIFDINFTAGTAEYFMPVFDMKGKIACVLYVKDDISAMAATVRKNAISKSGVNMIVNTSGQVLLNTDQTKENSENVLSNPDLKAIINEDDNIKNVKEVQYNNMRGLLGYRVLESMDTAVFIFTPYLDYKMIKTTAKTEGSAFLDSSFVLPSYVWMIIALLAAVFMAFSISAEPFTPVKKIVKALTHIDEESFQELLPKAGKGEYKRLVDSLIILRGRVKASEEKAEKLSQMSKELEEELSKEASKSDAEISELRDAVKIGENSKASLEEEISRLKGEVLNAKKDIDKKAENEKVLLNQKISVMEKELENGKLEIKKSQESKIPFEKENMRTDSVLMMNTELKGVLSVIKTYISSVLGGEGKITDAQQQFLGVVINKSARLERLINDLTELARLEKGEIKLAKQPVEVNNVIQDVIFAIQPQADIKKVEIRVQFSPTLPTAIGDTGRFSNVTSQLLNQAIKVSPRGGHVMIETKEDGKNVITKITDFGMSMPQSKASMLFINFHGPESNAGPEFVNSGLRFPIIKAIVNNMGGEIWVESEIGKGKAFLISLPKNGADSGKPAAAQKPVETAKTAAEPVIPAAAPKNPATEAKPAGIKSDPGFKIQRNDFNPSAYDTKKEEPLPTVKDLLNFDIMTSDVKKAKLPGTDVAVPPELIQKNAAAPAPAAVKKEEKGIRLPDELPPLPDLEDDKGIV